MKSRDFKPEGRPLPRSTLDANTTMMLLHNDPANVQTQSQPGGCPASIIDCLDLVEPLPDVLLLPSRQTRSLITDGYVQHCGGDLKPDFNRLLCRSVLHSIGEIVREDLPDASRINHRNDMLPHRKRNTKHTMWMGKALLDDDARDKRHHVRRFEAHLQLPGLNPRAVVQVGD